MPDAMNILQLSKLFGVTADYLLNDEFDNDLPKGKQAQEDKTNQILIYLVTIEVMAVFLQFMTTYVLKSAFFSGLSFLPFIAAVGGFEYAYRKHGNARSAAFRRKFYKISAWLGLYFPMRLLARMLLENYPGGLSFAPDWLALLWHILAATLISLALDKAALTEK